MSKCLGDVSFCCPDALDGSGKEEKRDCDWADAIRNQTQFEQE